MTTANRMCEAQFGICSQYWTQPAGPRRPQTRHSADFVQSLGSKEVAGTVHSHKYKLFTAAY